MVPEKLIENEIIESLVIPRTTKSNLSDQSMRLNCPNMRKWNAIKKGKS